MFLFSARISAALELVSPFVSEESLALAEGDAHHQFVRTVRIFADAAQGVIECIPEMILFVAGAEQYGCSAGSAAAARTIRQSAPKLIEIVCHHVNVALTDTVLVELDLRTRNDAPFLVDFENISAQKQVLTLDTVVGTVATAEHQERLEQVACRKACIIIFGGIVYAERSVGNKAVEIRCIEKMIVHFGIDLVSVDTQLKHAGRQAERELAQSILQVVSVCKLQAGGAYRASHVVEQSGSQTDIFGAEPAARTTARSVAEKTFARQPRLSGKRLVGRGFRKARPLVFDRQPDGRISVASASCRVQQEPVEKILREGLRLLPVCRCTREYNHCCDADKPNICFQEFH